MSNVDYTLCVEFDRYLQRLFADTKFTRLDKKILICEFLCCLGLVDRGAMRSQNDRGEWFPLDIFDATDKLREVVESHPDWITDAGPQDVGRPD